MHGISISHPAGWSVQRASEPWTGGPFFFQDPVGDFIYEPSLTDHLFLALASQPLGARSTEAWAAELLGLEGCTASEAVVVDGAEGLIGTDCGVTLVSKEGRGYLILLYVSGDDPEVGELYNRAWFEQVLATAKLDPQSAATSPSAPTPRPGEQRADMFRVPFSYVLPEDPTFDYGTRNETFWEIRVPEWFEAGHPAGVILQALGNGRRNPCDPASKEEAIPPSPWAVFEYLQAIKQLSVSDAYDATVGDPADWSIAAQAIVSRRADSATCGEIWPWTETTEPFVALPPPSSVRVVTVVEGGENLILTIFGEAENPVWSTKANAILASLRFESP